MALSLGTRLGPYEILAPLGAGGMGEVYRARDSRLGRDVALKILPNDRSADPDRQKRFESEARAVASLNHPHILALYDVGTHEGVPYAVMELLEGQTLRSVLQHGPLPVRKIVEYGVQICRGLAAAHERGVVHRDLKPENLFLTKDGQIKILDFGLAKLTGPVETGDTVDSQGPTATEPGVVMGTAGYMSPEQARGRPADARSDLFSVGAILYEMLSGRRAFSGDTAADTLSAILREDPPEIQRGAGAVPPGLESVVRRCLEKGPEERIQTARDLAFALETLSTAGGAVTPTGRRLLVPAAIIAAIVAAAAGYVWLRPAVGPPTGGSEAPAGRRMLVVLPFENLGAPEDAYFAAGMTEEITSRLAQVSGLGVISRTSAVQYDRTGKTARQIGEDLGAGFILEGTVRWDRRRGGPGRVRITPQLIRVADDTHFWTDRYDRVLDDIFAAQSEIAEAVVEQLGVALLPQERAFLEARPTENMEAYQAYLRGMEHSGNPWEHTRESQDLAVQMFERAIERDPNFVEAQAALADAHLSIYAAHERTSERLAQAREALDRALGLDPESPEAHLVLGSYYAIVDEDADRALEEYTFAARRRPNNSVAAELIARNLLRRGRIEEAVVEFERALDLDPRNALIARILGIAQAFLEQYREAERALDRAIALAPENPLVYEPKVQVYLQEGRLDRARATLEAMPGSQEAWRDWVLLETWERNFPAALDRLATVRTEGAPFVSVAEGDLHRLMNQDERARASYEAAVATLEADVQERSDGRARFFDEVDPHVKLAQAYAGLGRRAEAIREAGRVVELTSTSPNATLAMVVGSMPAVYAAVGEHETALDLLETLASSVPSWTETSYGALRFDPGLDPLREYPRFQKLLADKKRQLPPH